VSGVRGSQLLIPTLKDDPTDAEAISHKLLVRGGFIRQVGSGLYTYLPLGWRVMRQIDNIIREQMDTIGQEMLMPVLNPAELWQRTGRWDI
jgi:prolyl-tRNA synthetase